MQTTKPRARWKSASPIGPYWEITHPDTHVVGWTKECPRDAAARLLERYVLRNQAGKREGSAA